LSLELYVTNRCHARLVAVRKCQAASREENDAHQLLKIQSFVLLTDDDTVSKQQTAVSFYTLFDLT
jgi:hypothetical protein